MKPIGTISSMNVMRPIGQMCLVGLIGLVSLITFSCLLVSCGGGAAGEDDLSAPQGMVANEEMVPITFSGNQGTETTVTRADGTPLSDKGVDAFKVWGYKNTAVDYSTYQTVFPCYTVSWGANTAYTTTSNTNNWEYVGGDQTIKFWDWAATAYRFFAATGWEGTPPVSNWNYVKSKTYGKSGEGNTYEISMRADATNADSIAEAPYFSRLWFSNGSLTDYPDKQFGKPVTLEFLKPYARVRFIYTYVYPREGIVLTEQKFVPSVVGQVTHRKGVVKVTYPLTGANIQESYTMAPLGTDSICICQDYDPEDDTKTYYNHCVGGWYTVLPNTSQGSYTLSVYINDPEKNSDPKTAVVPAEYMQWKPGYSYTYIFKITDKGGVEIGWVDYAVTPWSDIVADHTVYNW